MVYLADLLVVMTDRLKIVRIRARNVHRVHGHKRLDDDAFLASLSLQKSDGVVCVMRRSRCRPVETKKIVSGQPAHVWQWPLSKKVVATVCRLHFDTNSEQSDCNKCRLGKNLEHPRLTR